MQEYLGEVSTGTIRDNFDIVYQVYGILEVIGSDIDFHQLLEEMLDNGYPLTTEPNALRDIITPPSLFKKILAVAGTAGYVIEVLSCPLLTTRWAEWQRRRPPHSHLQSLGERQVYGTTETRYSLI